jgi:pyruvate dehydrogenase E1 component alpha subunit
MPARTVDGMDAIAVRDAAGDMVVRARRGDGPAFLECVTYRFTTHSTASQESRPAEEIASWRARCPIQALAGRLLAAGHLDEADVNALRRQAEDEAAQAAEVAAAAPYPDPSEGLLDVE